MAATSAETEPGSSKKVDRHLERCLSTFLLPHFKFISNAPHGGQRPVGVILDLFPETFDMYVYGAGVSDVFVGSAMVEELLSGVYLVWSRSQEVQKLQFLRRHLHGMAAVGDRVVGQVDG